MGFSGAGVVFRLRGGYTDQSPFDKPSGPRACEIQGTERPQAAQDAPGLGDARAAREDSVVGRALPVLTQNAPRPAEGDGGAPAERKDAARNRKKILDAARKLMRTRGLDGLCMDELAAAAGVGKGTLYRRFTDKSALFRALLDDDEVQLQERARARWDLPKDAAPVTRLLTAWGAFVDFVVDHADVLAAAEAEVRRVSLCDSAPFHWRYTELVRELLACGVVETRAQLLAGAWLRSLSADIVKKSLEYATDVEVRATWKSLPTGFSDERLPAE